jgi:hypothetical protein
MSFVSEFFFDFSDENSYFYDLLLEEDFDFNNREISIDFFLIDSLKVVVQADSFLNLKIGVSSLMKSVEIIKKTLDV